MRQLRALIAIAALVLAGQAAAGRGQQPTTYTVQRGDSLSAIATKLKTTVDVLAKTNKLKDPGLIYAGQVLQLPKPAPAPASSTKEKDTPGSDATAAPLSTVTVVLGAQGAQTYSVNEGDNLSIIATKFKTTVDALAKANDLRVSKPIQIGQKLAIPGPSWQCPAAAPHAFSNDWGAPRSSGRRHQGNDLFAARGTPVLAPVGGMVFDGSGGLGGIAFLLAGTDGVVYYGAHLDKLTVKPGSTVAAGTQLGTVGDSGNAKGGATHLHFQVQYQGTWVNPFPTLSRWC
jgi:murein DD-endopeptidase MepM/ murein hydrolase activator NlpD